MNGHRNRFSTLLGTAALTLALGGVAAIHAAAEVGIAWVENTRGTSIALDLADNVYTVDYEQALGAEMSLTKRDANGSLLWVASHDQTDPSKWERASWVAADSAGNAIVCGTLMSGYSNPVEAASIAMKFSPDGKLLWRRVYESNFDGSSVRKCLVDADSSIYVLGVGSGPAGRVTTVKKFASDGTALWNWFDSSGIGAPVNFKLTPDGDIVITGRSLTGSFNGYARIDRDGRQVWVLAGVNSLTVGDSAGDASGNTYLVHGEYVLSNARTVITKLDPSGAPLWENLFAISGFRVEVGSDGQAVVSGFPNAGSGGAAFVKVNQNGERVWSNLDADGPLTLLAHAHLLLDAQNNVYLAAGTMSEMAVTRVNGDGTSGWTRTVAFGYAQAIALANTDDSVYVVGGTTARLAQGDVPALPAAPSGLTNELLTAASANLRWSDNSLDETGFSLERCTGTLLFCAGNPGAWSLRATTAANVTGFSDTGLAAATTYSWRVKAFNAVGSSGYSNTLSATTLSASIPAAPTDLKAQAKIIKSRAQVRLAWRDNATSETGYTVERCTGSTCSGFTPLATLPANSVAYTDAGVARAATYRYRVMAGGNGGNSPYSNIATVRTP